MTNTTIRTYETFEIHWADGAKWTGYDVADEAQRTIDFAVAKGGRSGEVVRRTFEVRIDPGREAMYRPGVSDRIVV